MQPGQPSTEVPSIVQYWHSERPPELIVETLTSFPEHNPALQHLVFDEATADAFIAEHFSARELTAFRSCAVPAMQADYFRYCAVFAMGGIYADADLRCVAAMRPLLDDHGGGILFGRQEPSSPAISALYRWPYAVGPYQAIGNGFFAFPQPNHPLLGAAIEIATANIEARIADGALNIWLVAGPGIFTSMYLLDRLGSIDAFIQYSAGSILEPSAHLFCEIVEDPARVEVMLDKVAIRSRSESRSWVVPVVVPRPESGADVHWQRFAGSIFK